MRQVLVLAVLAAVASAEVIVQLFQWRFDQIAEECRSFLPQYGYAAVQTSPVAEHVVREGRPWWESYQPFSYRVVTRLGGEEAFRDMVRVCNKAGVKVYVDVILNHMSATQPAGSVGTGGSRPDTANKQYPDVPYGPNDFHQTCSINNWNDPNEIRTCELFGLHDLNQASPYVQGKLVEFLNHLVDMGVAGFRVDAAKHIAVDQLAAIFSKVKNLNQEFFPPNSRAYVYQEISGNPDTDVIKPKDYFGIGSSMDFKYGFELSRAFQNQNQLKWFKTFGESWGLLPWNKSVVFIDNHDTQRDGVMGVMPLTYKQSKQYKMAVGFMLSWPHSVARVMSSYAFDNRDAGPPGGTGEIAPVVRNPDLSCGGGWVCEHRWRQIYSMAVFSNFVRGTPVREWWDNGNYQIAFCRGDKGFVAFNADSSPLNAQLQTCLPEGTYCDVVSGLKDGNRCTGKSVSVGSDGRATISLSNSEYDGFLAIHLGSKLGVNQVLPQKPNRSKA